MYWPTRSPTLLAPSSSSPVQHISPNSLGSLFLATEAERVVVWNVRPAVRITSVLRSPKSIQEHGTNISSFFSWDESTVLVVTSTSHLLVYSLHFSPPFPFSDVFVPSSSNNSPDLFLPGPGESNPIPPYTLAFSHALYIEGGISALVSTPEGCVLGAKHPPRILQLKNLAKARRKHGRTSKEKQRTRSVIDEVEEVPETEGILVSDILGFSDKTQQDSPNLIPLELTLSISHQLFTLLLPNSSYLLPYPLEVSSTSTAVPILIPSPSTLKLSPTSPLLAVGTHFGHIHYLALAEFGPPTPYLEKPLMLPSPAGSVTLLQWSQDGHALLAGYETGFALFSPSGRLNSMGTKASIASGRGFGEWGSVGKEGGEEDGFLRGVEDAFWVEGGLGVILLSRGWETSLSHLPMARSLVKEPSNTRYAFLQMDDRVLVYRGADQPDRSVITSGSDVWEVIKIPQLYLSTHHPLTHSSVSPSGNLVAVAGAHGFTHYSTATGRWKLFTSLEEEGAFKVRGGMVWFHHVLVAACEDLDLGAFSLRLFSRELDLTLGNVLSEVTLPSPVQLLSLLDNSLLVYTEDNTLFHFLILPAGDSVELRECGRISFEGVVEVPKRVGGMSWLIPKGQKEFGDPQDDLSMATIIFLIDSKLVLLRPKRSHRRSHSQTHARTTSRTSPAAKSHLSSTSVSSTTTTGSTSDPPQVKYVLQILADRIEAYWTHLSGIGSLENSLWGWDGQRVRVWLDALTIEEDQPSTAGMTAGEVVKKKRAMGMVEESVNLDLDFYPLSVLMDKGVIIGVEGELSVRRSLPFGMFKILTSTNLFLPHILRFHLTRGQVKEAIRLASHYSSLIYFSHALEILLHGVLEQEADEGPQASPRIVDGLEWTPTKPKAKTREEIEALPPTEVGVLPLVIEFLNSFDCALEVVVNCARKTEVNRWDFLFGVVGNPRDLFDKCLRSGLLKTATSYLLVLHTLEHQPDASSKDSVRLLRLALASKDFLLCKELLRFLHSIDDSGIALCNAIRESAILPPDTEGLEVLLGQLPTPTQPPPIPQSDNAQIHPPHSQPIIRMEEPSPITEMHSNNATPTNKSIAKKRASPRLSSRALDQLQNEPPPNDSSRLPSPSLSPSLLEPALFSSVPASPVSASYLSSPQKQADEATVALPPVHPSSISRPASPSHYPFQRVPSLRSPGLGVYVMDANGSGSNGHSKPVPSTSESSNSSTRLSINGTGVKGRAVSQGDLFEEAMKQAEEEALARETKKAQESGNKTRWV